MNLSDKDIERFWSKVNKDGPLWTNPDTGETSHCWEWQGSLNTDGYGRMPVSGKWVTAYRISFIITHDHLPDNLHHECHNPPCCNPRHLKDMTRSGHAKITAREIDPSHRARGDANGSRKYPERLAWGDKNWTHRNPEKVKHGEQHYKTKLTESDVIKIREQRKQGLTLKSIGINFGISLNTVWSIVKRDTWRHI